MDNKSNLSDCDSDLVDLTEEAESFPKVEAGQQLSNMGKKATENLSDSDSDLVDLNDEADMLKKGNKCFILLHGKTLNVDRNLIDHLKKQVPKLKVVDKVEECDFILVFCPVVSRPEIDIKAALQKLQNISDSKPAVVVVLHHTFDPDYVVPDSSRSVQREKTITADFLFHEDQGLLQCTRNTNSFTRIINYLNIQVPTNSWNYSYRSAHSDENNKDSENSKHETGEEDKDLEHPHKIYSFPDCSVPLQDGDFNLESLITFAKEGFGWISSLFSGEQQSNEAQKQEESDDDQNEDDVKSVDSDINSTLNFSTTQENESRKDDDDTPEQNNSEEKKAESASGETQEEFWDKKMEENYDRTSW